MKSVLYNIGEDGVPNISLWVDVHLKDDGSREKFYIINGDWEGVYCKGSVYINYTRKTIDGFHVGYFCKETNILYKRGEDNTLEAIKEGKQYD